jgi:hypothetical protein
MPLTETGQGHKLPHGNFRMRCRGRAPPYPRSPSRAK